MKCTKCYRPLLRCQACKGHPGQSILGDSLHCSKCRDTGWVCGDHDGYWE